MPHGDILGFAPPLVATKAEVERLSQSLKSLFVLLWMSSRGMAKTSETSLSRENSGRWLIRSFLHNQRQLADRSVTPTVLWIDKRSCQLRLVTPPELLPSEARPAILVPR